MPKTITIDGAVILQVRLTLDPNRKIQVHCEYQLRSGRSPIQSFNEEVTRLLTASDLVDALSLLNTVVQAIGADQGVTAVTA